MQADDAETFSYMSWLPVRFPRNIRCILTTNSSHLPSMARLTSRQVLTIAVQPLSEDLQKDIVENFFRTSNKVNKPLFMLSVLLSITTTCGSFMLVLEVWKCETLFFLQWVVSVDFSYLVSTHKKLSQFWSFIFLPISVMVWFHILEQNF